MSASRLVGLVVLALGPLLAPLAAGAQAPGNVHRMGIIHYGGVYDTMVDGLRQGLRELGLEEGKHLVLEVRTTGSLKAVGEAAKSFERARVDLIYTGGTSITLAASRATVRTPIVFFAGTDPVVAGLVESFAKPGGRLTGFAGRATDLIPKRLELLKEMIPRLGRVMTFYNPENPVARESARVGREAARQLGVEFVERRVGSVAELRLGLRRLKPREVDALAPSRTRW